MCKKKIKKKYIVEVEYEVYKFREENLTNRITDWEIKKSEENRSKTQKTHVSGKFGKTQEERGEALPPRVGRCIEERGRTDE